MVTRPTSLIAHQHLRQILSNLYKEDQEKIFFTESNGGYWSNLSEPDNTQLMNAIKEMSCLEAINAGHPTLKEVIFSPKRAAGLELLELDGSEVCADFGCMWGAIAVLLAKRCDYVVGFDQTLDSLRFAKKRATEEGVSNIDFVCGNLKSSTFPKEFFDVAVVNGVLEWIPESGHIDLTKYYAKFQKKRIDSRPRDEQGAFLKAVRGSLKKGGRLYLAIENRYDYKMFLGIPDPHPGIAFTSILPRSLANLVSYVRLGRPYVNYIYSFNDLKDLLKEAGFSSTDLYMCWPDYRFPDMILSYSSGLRNFRSLISSRNSQGKFRVRRAIARMVETAVFTVVHAKFFAPSIIAIAHK